jgi:hypothetical protein
MRSGNDAAPMSGGVEIHGSGVHKVELATLQERQSW